MQCCPVLLVRQRFRGPISGARPARPRPMKTPRTRRNWRKRRSRSTRRTRPSKRGTRDTTTRTIVNNHRLHPETSVTAASTARPRGTRLPRLARRRQLLDAAMEVFVARGYHPAAMDGIADRAGVSKPVLYQHFPGKQELYLALLDESVGRLVEAVTSAIRSTSDNRQRVNATFAAYFAYVGEHSGTFKLVLGPGFKTAP